MQDEEKSFQEPVNFDINPRNKKQYMMQLMKSFKTS
ncbi:hypothetical protein BSP22A_0171 [Salmonella phage BSP22A]|uniref:Uncharacterized protein n=1 Tax=Salmonella phage BSP22A TaxID=1960312 RepID=A0A2P0QDS9_9CAUD|nr:hypothetical protein BSP22A_0171 [Salmonella phage BSP22A]